MPKPFAGMPSYERVREDICFETGDGHKWKLVWEKCEYKAYMYLHGGWKAMGLGSTKPEGLIEYIERRWNGEQ